MKFKAIILPALFLYSVLQSVSAQKLIVSDELVVSVPASFPPCYTLDKEGKPAGFAIDVFEAVAARAGLRYRYQIEQSLEDTVQSLIRGQADLIPNAGIITSRTSELDFTSPVITFPLTLFVRHSNQQINSIEELSGRKVAVVSNNASYSELSKRSDITLVVFRTIDTAFFSLLSGQVDALAYPEPVMQYIAREFKLDDKIRALSPHFAEVKQAIAISKQSPQLTEILEQSLQAFMSSEEYKRTYRKWFSVEKPFWDVTSVFWSMTAVVFMLVIMFAVFRHRELLALNATLQKQIDEATQQLSESNEYLTDLTMTDVLTGISNRRAFENSLQSLMSHAGRHNDRFSMLILDIDDFKKLNDNYGHSMGDRVLVDLVERIQGVVRDEDELCRWGGEEFTILMPQTDHTGAMKMAERCRRVVADTLFDEVGPVTISLGVTCFCKGDSERKLFKRADDALYQAKAEGKNRVVWLGDKC